MIGPRHVVICGGFEGTTGTATAATQMMSTFTSIKLLILVSSKAGAVPGNSGQVRVGDVVAPSKVVMENRISDNAMINLSKASDLLATTSNGMETAQPWLLGKDIATLIAQNDRWGSKCGRPVGDDVDELDKIFVRQCQDASLAYHDGVVISKGGCPEDADYRDLVAVPLNLGSIVCFDDGQTAGLPHHRKDVDRVPVLGVSHYCDKNATATQRRWERHASMATAACAKRIVLGLDNENGKEDLDNKESRE